MKKKILLFLCFVLTSCSVSWSQVTNDISKVPSVSRGQIILTDGTSMSFKQLSVRNDSVIFTDSKSQIAKYPASGVYKISKTGNYAGLGALSCGLGGLLGSIVGTQNWKNNETLKGKEGSYITTATIVCTLIGGITGAMIKRDNILYKNSSAISFIPQIGTFRNNKPFVSLTIKIPIN